MRYSILLLLAMFSSSFCIAQGVVISGKVAYYSFDNVCSANTSLSDESNNGANGNIYGNPACGCGVKGNAIRLDGVNDYIELNGNLPQFMNRSNYSIAFFFKPLGATGSETIISRRPGVCNDDKVISVKIRNGANKQLTSQGTQSSTVGHRITTRLPRNSCWYHYVMTVSGNSMKVYINGELSYNSQLTTTPNLTMPSAQPLNRIFVGESLCIPGDGTSKFTGYLDEMYFFNRAIDPNDVKQLYDAAEPEEIITPREIIYLGTSFTPQVNLGCSKTVTWSPVAGVSDPTIAEPSISPLTTTLYTLTFVDSFNCASTDTMRITVIDPSLLGCDQVFLPTAFSPKGYFKNQVFKISNADIIDELVSFEIFDRWGSRLFLSTDKSIGWDGTSNGIEAPAGVYLLRVKYVCNGNENTLQREVTLMR